MTRCEHLEKIVTALRAFLVEHLPDYDTGKNVTTYIPPRQLLEWLDRELNHADNMERYKVQP